MGQEAEFRVTQAMWRQIDPGMAYNVRVHSDGD